MLDFKIEIKEKKTQARRGTPLGSENLKFEKFCYYFTIKRVLRSISIKTNRIFFLSFYLCLCIVKIVCAKYIVYYNIESKRQML